MKTLLIPAILVFVTLVGGFSTFQTKGKVMRTKEGLWIIPSDVKMSPEDVQKVVEIVKSDDTNSSAVAYNDRNGLLQIEGAYCLKDFREMSREFKVDLEPTRGSGLRGWFWRKQIKDDNHFKEFTIAGDARTKASNAKLEPILMKYMARGIKDQR